MHRQVKRFLMVLAVGLAASTMGCGGTAPPAPTCDDGIRNGDETDVDCGGGTCAACGDGGVCYEGSDCVSGECRNRECVPVTCGDGIIAGSEECDDGGETATCNADCTAARCGDGYINQTAGETCDDGGESAACNADCTPASCGDGQVNQTAGEDCDTGGTETTECDGDCTTAVCGDQYANQAAGEECDDGGESAACDIDCTVAMCGDQYVNSVAGEECDAGGETAQCDVDCTFPACGDGVLNTTVGEECDDGNNVDNDGCSANCTSEAPQVCDTGNDPITGDSWVVCAADANTAWISHNQGGGGTYRADLICQQLGYATVAQYGGNCGDICGYCDAQVTSCNSPGTRTFDNSNSCAVPEHCFTVTWLCSN